MIILSQNMTSFTEINMSDIPCIIGNLLPSPIPLFAVSLFPIICSISFNELICISCAFTVINMQNDAPCIIGNLLRSPIPLFAGSLFPNCLFC